MRLFLIVIALFSLSACGTEAQQDKELLQPFVKEWYCDEHLVEDEEQPTGYLAFYVTEDGKMSMYDQAAGNPGIEGDWTVVDEDTVLYSCTNKVDFDPPAGWEDMEQKQELTYRFEEDGNVLYLTYEDENGTATLKFFEEEVE